MITTVTLSKEEVAVAIRDYVMKSHPNMDASLSSVKFHIDQGTDDRHPGYSNPTLGSATIDLGSRVATRTFSQYDR